MAGWWKIVGKMKYAYERDEVWVGMGGARRVGEVGSL
jgi:hypothetical protein